MQIGYYIATNAQLQDNVKLENSKTIERNTQTQSSNDLSSLKEGAVFKGEIADISGDKVKIALENKGELMARLQEGVELGVGDKLLFSVKENTANQILIKPMFDSLYSAQTQVLEHALDMAGLSPTEKNFSAAKELMEAGLPVDKGSLVKLLSQSMRFEGTSMQTLVALNKMDIPVTKENIVQFERYQGLQHQLSGDIHQVADSMASFVDAFPTDVSVEALLSTTSEIMDLFLPEEDAGLQMPEADVAVETEEIGKLLETEVTQEQLENHQVLSEKEQVQSEENLNDNSIKEKIIGKENGPENQMEKEDFFTSHAEKQLQSSEGFERTGLYQEAATAERLGLSREEVFRLLNQLKKTGIPEEQRKELLNHSKDAEHFLKDMTKALKNSGADSSSVRNLLASDEFKKMLSETIKNNWALDPRQMKDPKEIDDLYDKIARQGKAFENIISAGGGDTGSFQQSSENMRQNMQFMEQINQQMIYAQMPLKLSNQNANSELYVYADKRKLMEKKDGISVMLHLDMDHLGETDIKVTLTGNNVNARFYLNDQQSVNIVADNMAQLARQLADRGFSLTNEVVRRTSEDGANKVVEEIIDENAERSIKRYTFDARM